MIVYQGKKLCENCFSPTTSDRCESCGFLPEEYSPDPTLLAVGSMLQNRYRIGGIIGKGGFGVTYIGFDMKLERLIAVKEYFPYGLALRTESKSVMSTGDIEVFRKGADKFYDEARMIAKFNSPANIVNVYDVFFENGTVYYVMEYLQGQTLKSYVENGGRLTYGQAVYIAHEIADALSVAHKMNVLHRDISPDNIMLCSDNKIKLIDFGAARQVVSESSQSLSVILTQGFAPLEQYQKKGKQGPWTDIYSLGASLYYGLTGVIIDDPMSRFEDDSVFQSNQFSIDSGLWEIIRKALMIKIDERFQSAAELSDALAALSVRPEKIHILEENSKIKVSSGRTVQLDDLQSQTAGNSMLDNSPIQAMPVGQSAQMNTMSVIQSSQMRTMPVNESSQMRTMPVNDASQMRTMPVNDASQMRTMPVNEVPQMQTSIFESKDKPKKKRIIPIIAGAVSGLVLIAVIIVLAFNGSSDDIAVEDSDTTTESVSETQDETTEETTAEEDTSADTSESENETSYDENSETEASDSDVPESVTIGGKSYKTDMTGVLNLMGLGLKNKDIADLKYMKNVSEIILSDNSLTDLSALSELTQLEKLTYHNNNVKDLSFAKNLKNLTVLGAENNGISDLSPLSDMTKLTEIWLQNNNISDMSPLKKCTNVNSLSLSGNPVKDCSAASGMTKIKNLHLHGCGLKSLEPFKDCTKLEYVYVGENQITDLTPLCGNNNLVELNAYNNALNGDYKALKGLTVLEKLDISGNGFVDPDELYEVICYDLYSDNDGFSYFF